MKPILLIGYGNQTRSDDGVGWYVANKIEKELSSEVDVLKLAQLTIELAEEIKDREFVIFVDAHVNDDKNWLISKELVLNFESGLTTHYLTPETLLAICEGLYNKAPKAHLFSIKGLNFDFGEKLSGQVKNAANQAAEQIIKMIQKYKDGNKVGET